MKANIKDFIPIILIYLLICVPGKVIPISHTYLGRFIAVLIIVFYAKMDVVLGLFVCVAIIYYYQMEEYEYMLNMTDDELWKMTYEQDYVEPPRIQIPAVSTTVSNSLLSRKLDTEDELMRKITKQGTYGGGNLRFPSQPSLLFCK
jgi:hypothetical protein